MLMQSWTIFVNFREIALITAKFTNIITGIFAKSLAIDFRNLPPKINKILWYDISSCKA